MLFVVSFVRHTQSVCSRIQLKLIQEQRAVLIKYSNIKLIFYVLSLLYSDLCDVSISNMIKIHNSIVSLEKLPTTIVLFIISYLGKLLKSRLFFSYIISHTFYHFSIKQLTCCPGLLCMNPGLTLHLCYDFDEVNYTADAVVMVEVEGQSPKWIPNLFPKPYFSYILLRPYSQG